MLNKLLFVAALSAVCLAQEYDEYQPPFRQAGATRHAAAEEPKPEVIAILKQINKHNEDGSYTYGYEGADGSFKIETKAANGDVKGKYGYVDGDGKVRTVEYGADKFGFQPSGEGITVAPIDYNAVPYEEEEQQQQYAPRPKQAPKAARPQPAYYAAPVVEKRKPAFAPSPAPQYYDYEEEIPTTQRPVQIQRPKYSIPSQPPQQPRPQQPVSSDYEYSFTPVQSAKSFAPQYQQYESRQPVQFPAETEAPTAAAPSRADDFALFSPAARSDFNKPQYAQQPFQFAPQPQPQQQQTLRALQRPAFASKPAQARSTSILDELAKDPNYVLKQTSPSLHDISFGYSL